MRPIGLRDSREPPGKEREHHRWTWSRTSGRGRRPRARLVLFAAAVALITAVFATQARAARAARFPGAHALHVVLAASAPALLVLSLSPVLAALGRLANGGLDEALR